MQTNQTTKTERNDTADRTARLARCAEALRRHGFEAVVTKDAQEAFERLRAAVEAEMPELVSFGDSMTMRDTGIVEWLRRDGRWRLLDGFDASMPRPERLEIRRQALLSDLFVTGINAVTEEGTLHWLDMVGNRIAPQQNRGRPQRGRRTHPAHRRAAKHSPPPRIPHTVRQNRGLHGLQLPRPHLQYPDGDAALPPGRARAGGADRRRPGIMKNRNA